MKNSSMLSVALLPIATWLLYADDAHLLERQLHFVCEMFFVAVVVVIFVFGALLVSASFCFTQFN